MDIIPMLTPTLGADEDEESKVLKTSSRGSDGYNDDDDDDEEEKDLETSDETDDPIKAGGTEKRKKKLRLARLKKKTKARAYEFSGGTDVIGIVFLDIGKITDLPPERNRRSPTVLHCMACWVLTSNSNKNIVRYGSLRGSLFGSEDLSDSGYPPQFESGVR